MTQQTIDDGLCANCLHKDLCTYHGSHVAPIVFCEEFGCADPGPHWHGQADISDDIPASDALAASSLCGNCGHLDTCSHPGKNNRITYCEDYS